MLRISLGFISAILILGSAASAASAKATAPAASFESFNLGVVKNTGKSCDKDNYTYKSSSGIAEHNKSYATDMHFGILMGYRSALNHIIKYYKYDRPNHEFIIFTVGEDGVSVYTKLAILGDTLNFQECIMP